MLDTHIIFNKVHTYIIFLCFGLDIFDVQSCFRDQYFGRSPCMCILATHIISCKLHTYIMCLWLALTSFRCSQIFVCLYFDCWTCRAIDVIVFFLLYRLRYRITQMISSIRITLYMAIVTVCLSMGYT